MEVFSDWLVGGPTGKGQQVLKLVDGHRPTSALSVCLSEAVSLRRSDLFQFGESATPKRVRRADVEVAPTGPVP